MRIKNLMLFWRLFMWMYCRSFRHKLYLWYKICRSPSKRYARRTVGPCTSRDVMLDSRRSTPLLDGYAGSPVNHSVDNYSQRSASDGRQSISSSTCSPVSRQPVNSWTSYRTSSAGFTASPPNSADSVITKSANPVLRSTLPADYKPSGYGTTSRSHIRSNSSNSSIGGDNRPRPVRSPATGSESSRNDSRMSRSGDQSYGSLTRRRTYDSSRVNGSGRRSSKQCEQRVTPDQSSEWQVNIHRLNVYTFFILFTFKHTVKIVLRWYFDLYIYIICIIFWHLSLYVNN